MTGQPVDKNVLKTLVPANALNAENFQELAGKAMVEEIPAGKVIFKTGEDPSVLMKKLSAGGVLVRNMIGYPELAGYLRVNAGSPDENKVFLRALEDTMYSSS